MDEKKKEKIIYKENSFYKWGFWILAILLVSMCVLGFCSPVNKQYDTAKDRFETSKPFQYFKNGKENIQNGLKPNGNIEKETSNYYTKYPSNKYQLRYHETLANLAMRFHVSVPEIVADNPNLPSSSPTKPIPPGTVINAPKDDTMTAKESSVLDLVNKERAKQGLSALKGDSTLNKVASAKASDMKNKNYFDHNSPTYGSPFEMMKTFGVTYNYAGENIAKGYDSASSVMQGWMNSPGHRANILNPNFTHMAVAEDGQYWAQEFIGK